MKETDTPWVLRTSTPGGSGTHLIYEAWKEPPGSTRMIRVNGKTLDWEEGLTFDRLFQRPGYTIKNPPVVVRVENKLIKKAERDTYTIPDGVSVEIKTMLRGG